MRERKIYKARQVVSIVLVGINIALAVLMVWIVFSYSTALSQPQISDILAIVSSPNDSSSGSANIDRNIANGAIFVSMRSEVITNNIAIYTAPTTNSTISYILEADSVVRVMSISNEGWTRILTPSGMMGWLPSYLLTVMPSSQPR